MSYLQIQMNAHRVIHADMANAQTWSVLSSAHVTMASRSAGMERVVQVMPMINCILGSSIEAMLCLIFSLSFASNPHLLVKFFTRLCYPQLFNSVIQ